MQTSTDEFKEFQFLTAKPVIVVVNAGEDQVDEVDEIQERLDSEIAEGDVLTAVLIGSVEMELGQMSADDEAEFRESLAVGESGLDRMVRLSYRRSTRSRSSREGRRMSARGRSRTGTQPHAQQEQFTPIWSEDS